MNAHQDESQQLDAGWDEAADPQEVDQAWDSVPAPSAAPSSSAPAAAAATEELDGGWDDAAIGTDEPANGKRRPHRPRRTQPVEPVGSAQAVVAPRPAENTKKQQRAHLRQKRLQEAKTKQERKAERKAQRAAEAIEQIAARIRQTEAEERARSARREARERAQRERPISTKPAKIEPKNSPAKRDNAWNTTTEIKRSERRRGFRWEPVALIGAMLVAALLAWFVLRK
jgi:hypothetical protein